MSELGVIGRDWQMVLRGVFQLINVDSVQKNKARDRSPLAAR